MLTSASKIRMKSVAQLVSGYMEKLLLLKTTGIAVIVITCIVKITKLVEYLEAAVVLRSQHSLEMP